MRQDEQDDASKEVPGDMPKKGRKISKKDAATTALLKRIHEATVRAINERKFDSDVWQLYHHLEEASIETPGLDEQYYEDGKPGVIVCTSLAEYLDCMRSMTQQYPDFHMECGK